MKDLLTWLKKAKAAGSSKAAEALSEVSAMKCRVIVAGGFSAGKSTFLSAVCGRPIFPTGTLPTTSFPTMVEAGKEKAVFFYKNGAERELSVDEAAEELKEKSAITAIESVKVSGNFRLPSHVWLLDLPGFNSVQRGHSEISRDAQHEILVYLLNASAPLSGNDLQELKNLSTQSRRVIIVINKIDLVDETEQPLSSLETFVRESLQEKVGLEDFLLFSISALEQGPLFDKFRRSFHEILEREGELFLKERQAEFLESVTEAVEDELEEIQKTKAERKKGLKNFLFGRVARGVLLAVLLAASFLPLLLPSARVETSPLFWGESLRLPLMSALGRAVDWSQSEPCSHRSSIRLYMKGKRREAILCMKRVHEKNPYDLPLLVNLIAFRETSVAAEATRWVFPLVGFLVALAFLAWLQNLVRIRVVLLRRLFRMLVMLGAAPMVVILVLGAESMRLPEAFLRIFCLSLWLFWLSGFFRGRMNPLKQPK